MIIVPAIMYGGGIINTYQAYNIFQEYKFRKDLWYLMEKEGVFMDKSNEE